MRGVWSTPKIVRLVTVVVRYQAKFSGKSNYKHRVRMKNYTGCWEFCPLRDIDEFDKY